MGLELNFKYAGIDWLVTVGVNDEWGLEQIFKVEVYDNLLGDYKLIRCDLAEFEKDMQDQINGSIEEEKTAAKSFAEDMAYEQAREEGRLDR